MKYLSIIILSLLVSCYGREPEKTGMEGKLIPSFNILLMDSTTKLNTKDIQADKPFILFLFDPQCSYSKAQMESIVDNMDQLKNVNIYTFTGAPFILAKEFYEKYELKKYSNIIAGVDRKDIFANYMAIRGVPFIAIYDNSKKLKGAFTGKTEVKSIQALLSQ
jgi:hypothetical protein